MRLPFSLASVLFDSELSVDNCLNLNLYLMAIIFAYTEKKLSQSDSMNE